MKKYHVATGDGKAYYGVGYESYREAEGVLEFSQRHDPQAHIVEEEYHFTNADRIRAMSDEELANMRVFYNPETDMYTADTGEAYYDFVSAMEAELEWLKQPVEVEG